MAKVFAICVFGRYNCDLVFNFKYMAIQENPHLSLLLSGRGLTINPKVQGAKTQFGGTRYRLGDLVEGGEVVGFCDEDSTGSSDWRFTMVVFDESKEGSPEALAVIPGLWALEDYKADVPHVMEFDGGATFRAS